MFIEGGKYHPEPGLEPEGLGFGFWPVVAAVIFLSLASLVV